ncbi:MAG: IPT/TIG domain-containing protein [Acidobacteriota bacterium]|nr:IPT/TIG domain-containing protein [Acidobacteriota bacterium]
MTFLRRVTFLPLVFLATTTFAATRTVTSANDSGAGTLREAMNLTANGDTIAFAIGSGAQTIALHSPLPSVNGVTIDGRTQPGYASKPLIEIDGSAVPAGSDAALVSLTNGSSLIAVVINQAPAWAVLASNASVSASYIGTDRDGTFAKPNRRGIAASGSGTIRDNVISGNTEFGLQVSGTNQITATSNRFGTTASGSPLAAQTQTQINLVATAGSPANVTIQDNVIGGATVGIQIDFGSTNATITGNFIGITRNGQSLPNAFAIVIGRNSSNNAIRNNVIANATGAGISAGSGTGNVFLGNEFGRSLAIAIDLDGPSSPAGSGHTPNDAEDRDSGPNNLLNFPVIERATELNGTMTISGSLKATPNSSFVIELYRGSRDAAAYGASGKRIAAVDVQTDANGAATFTHSMAQSAAGTGNDVFATTTSTIEGTSELSRAAYVIGAGAFQFSRETAATLEFNGGIAFEVLRIGGAGAASVGYTTADGSAKAGSDYTAKNGVLSFEEGETSKSVFIPFANDAFFEGDQTFTVTLQNAVNGEIRAPSTIQITIIDDEQRPRVSYVRNTSVVEGDSGTKPMQFLIGITVPSEAPLVLSCETSSSTAKQPADFIAASGSVTFAPGEVEKTFSISIVGDKVSEPTEYVRVRLTLDGRDQGSVSGEIRDNEPIAEITISDIEVTEGNGPTNAVLTLRSTQPVGGQLVYQTVAGTAVAGEDFETRFIVVQFDDEMTRNITVPIRGDVRPEPTEQFSVQLLPMTENITLGRSSATVTIVDDDPGVGPSALQIAVGEKSRASIQVSTPPATDATFLVTTNAPNIISVPASVVLPAGSNRVSFDVRALAQGVGDVTVTFPQSYGGNTASIRVTAYTAVQFTLVPAELTLYPGQATMVHAILQPANTTPVVATLNAGAEVSTQPAFLIPPGGHGTFEIKGVNEGLIFITARLPIEYGNATANIVGRVVAAPTTPTILGIQPEEGSTAGGMTVDVSGILFRNDCTVTFGGVPASTVFVNAQSLRARTPAHTAGAVDVGISCGLETSTLRDAFTYRSSAPMLSSIVPTSGTTAGGTAVRILGSDIAASCWPYFGDAPAVTASVRDATLITATTPQHAAGTTNVRLVCTGFGAELTAAFTFNNGSDPAPQITNISPLTAAPGEIVSVAGLNFRHSDAVTFGNVPARVLDTLSTAQIVVVPDAPAGKVSVNVTRAGGPTSTSGPLFTITEAAPPQITRVTPAAAAGAEIVLQGTALRTPYMFAIDGRVLPNVALFPTRAVVRLPNDIAPGDYPIAVLNAAGKVASVGPSINVRATGVVVRRVSQRCSTTEGGIDVTIEGAGFAPGATVTFNTTAATNVTVVDATTITARVPANNPRPATIIVTNFDGTTSTLTAAFRYASPFDPLGCASTAKTRGARH